MKLKFYLLLVLFSLNIGFVANARYTKIAVLVYTSPDVWHNEPIPTAITQFKELAEKHFMDLTWTQIENSFKDDYLSKFSVIVFLHSNDTKLSKEQQESFKKFIQNGGGFVGIHATAVNGKSTEWFKKLVGRTFTSHPEKQTAVMSVVDKKFPATMHLPDNWVWTDEWYEFGEALTDNLHTLLTVDESTYVVKKGMGKNHPIAWYQEYDGGRSFYTGLGHIESSYNDPLFLNHIFGGIYWAATGRGIVK